MSTLLTTHPVIDDVLERFQDRLGPDLTRYRNHVYRGLNYQRMLLQLDTVPDEIALAWVLHDIGLWTAGWDYIGPSSDFVDDLAPDFGITDIAHVKQMVELHHKLRPCADEWSETFRVADRIDVSMGLLKGPLARSDIAQVVQAFPFAGFHALLVRTAAGWAVKHPLRPMPMLRW